MPPVNWQSEKKRAGEISEARWSQWFAVWWSIQDARKWDFGWSRVRRVYQYWQMKFVNLENKKFDKWCSEPSETKTQISVRLCWGKIISCRKAKKRSRVWCNYRSLTDTCFCPVRDENSTKVINKGAFVGLCVCVCARECFTKVDQPTRRRRRSSIEICICRNSSQPPARDHGFLQRARLRVVHTLWEGLQELESFRWVWEVLSVQVVHDLIWIVVLDRQRWV